MCKAAVFVQPSPLSSSSISKRQLARGNRATTCTQPVTAAAAAANTANPRRGEDVVSDSVTLLFFYLNGGKTNGWLE